MFSLSGFNSWNRERLPVHQNPSRTAELSSLLSPTSGTRLRVLSLTISRVDLSAFLYFYHEAVLLFSLEIEKYLGPNVFLYNQLAASADNFKNV